MRDKIYDFVKTNFIFDERKVLNDDDSLLGSGIIDSTGVLELISFLEKEFSVTFEDKELVGENFDSISKIVSLMRYKTNTL